MPPNATRPTRSRRSRKRLASGGRGAHGLLQRALLGGPCLREAVEEDHDVRVPLGMPLVDDERPAAGSRPPVDRADEVARARRGACPRTRAPRHGAARPPSPWRPACARVTRSRRSRSGRRVDLQRTPAVDASLEADETDPVARPEPHVAELDRRPARAAQAERELALLVGGEPQRDGVAAFGDLDPLGEREPHLEPVDRRRRHRTVTSRLDDVALERSLAIELDPGLERGAVERGRRARRAARTGRRRPRALRAAARAR